MMDTLLVLDLVLLSHLPRPAGMVVFLNRGQSDVRIWERGNRWGDTALAFELIRNGQVSRIVRREQVYTRNVPSSVTVPAGARHEWPFDLGDGEWESDGWDDRSVAPGAQLVAVYSVPASPEALDHGVHSGQLLSEAISLDE